MYTGVATLITTRKRKFISLPERGLQNANTRNKKRNPDFEWIFSETDLTERIEEL